MMQSLSYKCRCIKSHTYIAAILFIVISEYGCIPVPVPWKSEDPLFSEQELSQIQPGTSSRNDVVLAFGEPDVIYRDNQLWFYRWSQNHGKIIVLPYPVTSPLYDTKHALIIEFDDNDIVLSMDVDSGGNGCRKDGVCLRNRDIVTDTTARNNNALQYVPESGICGVYLYTDDWLAWFTFANQVDKPLDNGTYVLCKQPPGIKSIQVSTGYTANYDRTYKFECPEGENIYVYLQSTPYGIMRLQQPDIAKNIIRKRRLQMLDCTE